jgi:ribosomal 50S subunit-recycling heat shock protein
MRLDDFLSTVGVVKRRTLAKEISQKGQVEVNGRKAKPAYQVKESDVIRLKGIESATFEVIAIPTGSVAKERREEYYRIIS